MKQAIITTLSLFFLTYTIQANVSKNGFDLSDSLISANEIHKGGPPRDGIPSIDNPILIKPEQVDFLNADDKLVSVSIGGTTRAYPLSILVWHEIVNDTINEQAIAVTYCPLCGTAMVFDRTIDGKTVSFGVSGLLYNSDVLMYDRNTESLWSQLMMKAVSGRYKGKYLHLRVSDIMTWESWEADYPQGKVLSTETGYNRDYQRQPYTGYELTSRTYFPVAHEKSLKLRPKEWVAGALIKEQAIAFQLDKFVENEAVTLNFEGRELNAYYNPKTSTFRLTDVANKKRIPTTHAFAFAWHAFYPDSSYWPQE